MDTENHPDPFQDAMHQGVQRAIQLASGAVTAAQVYLFHRKTQARAVGEHDDRARRALHAQIRAERQAGRTGWAPALDLAWLRKATLLQAARAWSAAVPYSDRAVPWYEPAAATAMRTCEERLRELHPYAVARYDRLRADGLGPAEAMQEAAPLFARPARAHDASSAPRPMLGAGESPDLDWAAGAGPAPGGPGDLPAAGPVLAERDRAARAGRSARPWERDFPIPIRDVVAAAGRTAAPAAPRPVESRAPSPRAARVSGSRA